MKKGKTKKDNHLKALNTITDSCCTYCNCDCYSEHDVQSTSQKNPKRPKRSKSANSFTRDCKILKELNYDILPQISAIENDNWLRTDSFGQLDICNSMQNLCLSPKVFDAFSKIPLHDKKIVDRMARSRSEKALLNENSWLARKFWENEKYERDLLKCEQMVEYRKAVEDKQYQDYQVTKARLAELNQRDMRELEKLRSELNGKDDRLKRRLKTIKLENDILQCQRRQDELRKSEAVILAQEEQNIDEQLRKQNICLRLENRLSKADSIRQHFLNAHLRRLKYDNYVEQILHEENYRETKEFEKFKTEELKQRISRKKSKTDKFIQKKQLKNNEIIEKAKISADLRDLVRKSVSPDHMQQCNHGRSFTDRSWTNLSFRNYL